MRVVFLRHHELKRSRRQIFAEILELCRKPKVKTRIQYQTNLSYKLLQKCLAQLQMYKLLEEHHSQETYSTTEKGLDFLQKWTELEQLLAPSKVISFSNTNKIPVMALIEQEHKR